MKFPSTNDRISLVWQQPIRLDLLVSTVISSIVERGCLNTNTVVVSKPLALPKKLKTLLEWLHNNENIHYLVGSKMFLFEPFCLIFGKIPKHERTPVPADSTPIGESYFGSRESHLGSGREHC